MALLLLLLLLTGTHLTAQTIAGTVNLYFPVSAVTSCTITVPSTTGLAAGDRILIIQMQGVAIDQSNTAGFGAITSYGNAGAFEFATISAVTPTTIALRNRLVGAYTPAARVQVVRVPSFADVAVAGTLTCPPWNGIVGGVIAVEATGTITLNSGINANGMGFRGGAAVTVGTGCGGTNTEYFYPSNSIMGAIKGESVSMVQVGWACGRGANANGGGGGNNHNGGGGGGSNVGVGGTGGSEWNGCAIDNLATCGIPGYALDYNPGTRVFMGGGGGAGHANENSGTSGGNGGGIVILRAGTLRGAGRITSNGLDVPLEGGTTTDGCGGGGGGGSVLLDVRTFGNTISVDVKGGSGGSTPWSGGKIGPGGGGGGGLVWISGTFPGSVIMTASGGTRGVHTPNGDSWGAAAGTVGGGRSGLVIAEGTQPAVAVNITPAGPVKICLGDSVALTSTPGFSSYQWSPAGGNRANAVARPAQPGTHTYSVTAASADGCVSVASIDIEVLPAPKAYAGPDVSICTGFRQVIGWEATGGTPPYTYSWEPATGLNGTSSAQVMASPTTTTTYIVTVGDSKGVCVSRDTVVVTVNPSPQLPKLRDTTICYGTTATIGAVATGGTGAYRYAWTPAATLVDSTAPLVTARPLTNTDYVVKVIDARGCVATDTVRVTVRAKPVVAAGPDTTICAGDTVQLTATAGAGYLWSPAAGLSCSTCRSPKASPGQTTTYTVAVTDADGCTGIDSVLVSVPNAVLAGMAGPLDFGAVEGCQTNTERTLVLRNTGTDTIRVDSATFSAEGFAAVAPQFPVRIPGGDSVIVRLRFTPLLQGITNAKLHVHGQPCGADYLLDVRGEKSLTAVTTRPGNVAFGDVYACDRTPVDTTITVYNVGTDPLVLEAGFIPAPFSILSPIFPQTITPGDSMKIVLRYAPAAEGSFTGQLRLPFHAGSCKDTLRLPVDGRYAVPRITALPAVNFGELVGCDTGSDTAITIHNPGTTAVVIGRADIPAGFRLLSPLPVTIEPGADAELALRFEPQQNGTDSGRLLAIYEPCTDTLAIDLRGAMSGVSYRLPDTLDFGALPACAGVTVSRDLLITNTSAGGVGGSVGGVAITGPFTAAMRAGDTLPNGAGQRFDVVVTPTTSGDVSGTLEITILPCGIKRTVVLKAYAQPVGFIGDMRIDFGAVPNGTPGFATGTYRNTGQADLMVTGLRGLAAPFAVEFTQPALPALLKPGEELTVRLRFDAVPGAQQSAMQVDASPCSLTLDVEVIGEGTDATAWAVLSMPVLEAAPGEPVFIAPVIDSSRNLAKSGATRYTVQLRFNRTLLIPTGNTPFGTIQGNEHTVVLSGMRGDTLGPMGGFEFIAALGDTEETPLTMEQFEWRDGTPVLTSVTNGLFRLRGLCRDGGTTRLLNTTLPPGLKPARPNPADGVLEIEYRIIEAGRMQLYLVDLLGRRAATLAGGLNVPGAYVTSFDVSSLPEGVYFCVLETGVDRFVQQVRVVR